MHKSDPRSLAIDLLERSSCSVKVAAVIFDSYGIFAWGWNSVGPTGYGWHAEHHAISRANPNRLFGAHIAIAGDRRGNIVPSIPCAKCQSRLKAVGITVAHYQNREGGWLQLHLI